VVASGVLSALGMLIANAAEVPRISKLAAGGQLIVNGKPYLILGGELGNSSAGTASQADSILPQIAKMHVNTVLMPVAWEQIEAVEGRFDFSIVDHWIDVALEQRLHLVVLWFGSWKNGVSSYAPAWVKKDTKRFPRAVSAKGDELEILSTLGAETVKSDGRAFSELMKHIREKDQEQQTVLMAQVENEVGYLGRGRDRSEAANRLFRSAVPPDLIRKLQSRQDSFSPELRAHFNAAGKTWMEVFGDAANEVFMAWNYARTIEAVAAQAKRNMRCRCT
jgi:beta-galactosidase GanA